MVRGCRGFLRADLLLGALLCVERSVLNCTMRDRTCLWRVLTRNTSEAAGSHSWAIKYKSGKNYFFVLVFFFLLGSFA